MVEPTHSPPEDLVEAMRNLPLFPLPQAVLFPGMLLPLHVFEPRYRQLVQDALASHRSLSVPQLSAPDPEMAATATQGAPAIASIAGIGTIIDHTVLSGGRMQIMLLGRARVKLQELTFEPPYRRALATLARSYDLEVPGPQLAALQSTANAFAALVRRRDDSFKLRIPKDAPHSALVDAYAYQLVIDARERQAVLETLSVRERAQQVTEILAIQQATLRPERGTVLN